MIYHNICSKLKNETKQSSSSHDSKKPKLGTETAVQCSLKQQLNKWVRLESHTKSLPDSATSALPAGYAFFTIFMLHDLSWKQPITLSESSTVSSFSTTGFNLQTLYGDRTDRYLKDGKFSIGQGMSFAEDDLLRKPSGKAILADERNDAIFPLSQLTLGMQKYHNVWYDCLRAEGKYSKKELSQKVREQVEWHYQWIILNDFLPRITGWSRNKIKKQAQTPKIFNLSQLKTFLSTSSLRITLNLIRHKYLINEPLQSLRRSSDAGYIQLLPKAAVDSQTDQNLTLLPETPGKLLPFRSIQWNLWLSEYRNKEIGQEQFCSAIRSTLPSNLMTQCIYQKRSLQTTISELIQRDLKQTLPSGAQIAEMVGLPPIPEIDQEAPIWEYLVKESMLSEGGKTLGPLGSTLYSHLIVQILLEDNDSFLRQNPDWSPQYKGKGPFTLCQLLEDAGMPISEEDVQMQMGL